MKRRKENDGFEQWGGYMNAKITKLQQQFEEDAGVLNENCKISSIFDGVSIFVNGLTEPSSEALRRIMLQHGGTFHDYQVSSTTHVIASNLPNAKLQQQAFARVLRPEWIVDSVAAGKILPTTSYLLCARPALQPPLNLQATHDKRIPAKNAADSNFLSEFYNKSRLHHLSTMGALLKQHVAKLKETHDGQFPGIDRLRATLSPGRSPRNTEKVVIHIDMDSFFVSVSVRDRLELVGKPIAVTHAKGNNAPEREGVDRAAETAIYAARMGGFDTKYASKGGNAYPTRESMSEIASCSYEARARGVKNGMYLGRALSLCPGLVTVPYDFDAYTEVSYTLYDTVSEYTLAVEAVSCDEMFIDCTSVLRATGATAMEFAACLRKDVTDRTRCPCSTGIGANKLQARLASKKAKPNGQYHVLSADLDSFMRDIRVKDLPGVGWSTARKLEDMAVENCADLQLVGLATLKAELGDKNGDTLYRFCRGQDDRPVVSEHQRKSVSAEVNYGIRFTCEQEALDFLRRLSGEVSERLNGLSLRGRCLTLKLLMRSADAPVESAKFLGHGVCDNTSKSLMLPNATADMSIIAEHVLKLYKQTKVLPEDMRGIGIQLSKLEGNVKSGALQYFLERQRNKKHLETNSLLKKEKNSAIESKNVETTLNVEKNTQKKTRRKRKVDTEKGAKHSTDKPVKGKDLLPKKPWSSIRENAPRLPPICELDPAVIKALPEEIQKEILAQYGANTLPGLSLAGPSTSKDIPTPPELFEDNSRDSVVSSKRQTNIFEDLAPKEVRDLVGSWVELENKPQAFDVEMLWQHASLLVHKRDIEIVSVLLKCFWRNIKKHRHGEVEWASAYDHVVNNVQESMLLVYNNYLLLPQL